jgi:hypothetical protein
MPFGTAIQVVPLKPVAVPSLSFLCFLTDVLVKRSGDALPFPPSHATGLNSDVYGFRGVYSFPSASTWFLAFMLNGLE